MGLSLQIGFQLQKTLMFSTKNIRKGTIWKSYDFNAFLRDIISGLTVACIRLPQDCWWNHWYLSNFYILTSLIIKSTIKGLAYGALATVPPIHGLYTGKSSKLMNTEINGLQMIVNLEFRSAASLKTIILPRIYPLWWGHLQTPWA